MDSFVELLASSRAGVQDDEEEWDKKGKLIPQSCQTEIYTHVIEK